MLSAGGELTQFYTLQRQSKDMQALTRHQMIAQALIIALCVVGGTVITLRSVVTPPSSASVSSPL